MVQDSVEAGALVLFTGQTRPDANNKISLRSSWRATELDDGKLCVPMRRVDHYASLDLIMYS